MQKLVRDKIPEIVKQKGEAATVRFFVLKPHQFLLALQDKLMEEAREVGASTDRESLIEELADLQEVVEALRDAHGIKWDEVRRAQTRKRIGRGGFDAKICLDDGDDDNGGGYRQ